MAEKSGIEWTDNTFNPWIGCTKVSAGCANCYAETLNNRHGWAEWGKGGKRKRTSARNWRLPTLWNQQAEIKGIRLKVFCASLADWLDEEVDEAWRTDLFKLVKATPNLDWLMLTKRHVALDQRTVQGFVFPDNVWLGVSAENQEMWDRRVPILCRAKAKVKFVSAEPLLSGIVMGQDRPDWLIVGGESGANSRPMKKEWVEDLKDQCDSRTAFFFKQWGGKDKKAAGKELNGKTYLNFPNVT